MTYETLKVAIGEDRVGLITMNRPEARNAMNTRMMEELRDLFCGLLRRAQRGRLPDRHRRGRRGFCSGGDLKERKGMTDETWRRQHAIVEQMMRAIMDCPIPVIAAVNGAAYAGGMEIALGLRFRLRGAVGALRADRGDARHHAGRGRHAEPAARGRRAPRQGAGADRGRRSRPSRRWRGAWSTRCARTRS